MASNFLRVLLVVILGAVLVRPAEAETLDTARDQLFVGMAVVGAAVVVGVIFLVRHEKHKTAVVTGCVAPGGASLTDQNNKRIYTLSGDLTGVKAGERMTLQGKKRSGGLEVRSVTKDLGVCP